MCKNLDLPIGFQFAEGNDVLEVRSSEGVTPVGCCKGCYFLISVHGKEQCSGCSLQCSTDLREDDTDVIFAKVGEVKYDRTNE